jgi:aerobic carbon-monoxide dehydrogenase large subunit
VSDELISVRMTVNGVMIERRVEPRFLLADFLRAELGLTGTHVGCAHGVCGACTVMIDGQTGRSCLAFAVQMDGARIETVEALAGDGPLTPLQQAFQENHALQCGFCTSGMLMSAGALLARNADPNETEIRRALAGNLCRCTGYVNIVKAVKVAAQKIKKSNESDTAIAYAETSEPIAARTGDEAIALIGKPVLRKEDPRLLRGRGQYIDDIPEPPSTLHLAFVLSSRAHARILSIDIEAAAQSGGVVAIYTGRDFECGIRALTPDIEQTGFQSVARPTMASDRVRFVGEAIAVVVARNPYLAEDAADLVRVEYEDLPVLSSMEAAVAADAIRLHGNTRDNVLFRGDYRTDGFDEAFAAADLVVRDIFESPRLAALSIEPRGCLAVYDAGLEALTFYTSTQIPHIIRTGLADALNWDETRLRVVAPDVGGGFGMKAYLYPEELVTAFLARALKAPVKWVCDRREDLLSSVQGRGYRFDIALAFTADGDLIGTKADFMCDLGAYPGYPFGSATSAGGAALYLPGPYRMKHYCYETRAVTTNTCPSGVYRGVAAPSAFFATEALMDRAARTLGIDPADIRRRNVLTDVDIPYTSAVGVPYTSGTFEKCLRRALDESGYEQFRRAVPANRMVDGKLRGIGIGCIVEHTGQGASRYRQRGIRRVPGFDSAQVQIAPNGRAVVYVSQATQGQGHLTAFAQIAAEVLGLNLEDVTVIEGDTAFGGYGTGTFASRGAVLGGGAVMRAAGTVRQKLLRIAADVLEADQADLTISSGRVHVAGVSGLSIPVRDLATMAYSMHDRALPAGESFGLEATDYYDPPRATITNATHIAQVAVDTVTGLVKIERYVVVHDCGRIINPLIVEGQIHGAVVQGTSSVLSEALYFDEQGQATAGSLLDYLVSTAMDVPDIEVHHEESWSPDTEGGFKGVGEGGVIGALPAVVNAIADALITYNGKITRLPVRPEIVMGILTGGR